MWWWKCHKLWHILTIKWQLLWFLMISNHFLMDMTWILWTFMIFDKLLIYYVRNFMIFDVNFIIFDCFCKLSHEVWWFLTLIWWFWKFLINREMYYLWKSLNLFPFFKHGTFLRRGGKQKTNFWRLEFFEAVFVCSKLLLSFIWNYWIN
jgi:hypothetical protein